MPIDVPEQAGDDGQAFEIVASGILIGHRNTAVELDGFLTNESTGLANLDLHRRDGSPALRRILTVDVSHVNRQQGTALFERNEHVHQAVLQRLGFYQ